MLGDMAVSATSSCVLTSLSLHVLVLRIGDVKVFDFGLCKNLSPKLKTKDGMFKLTGRTGSFPYMAPGKCRSVLEEANEFMWLHPLCIVLTFFCSAYPHRGGSMSSL